MKVRGASKMNVKRYKKGDNQSYTLGTTLTIELLKQKPEICKVVYLHPDLVGDGKNRIIALCEKENIPYEINTKVFNILSQKENCFAIGVFDLFSCELEKEKNHVVLVNPSNFGNLGTIMRSMCGFGIKDLAIITPAVDVFDPNVVRSSMGAVFDVRFKHFSNFEDYVNYVGKRTFYPFMLQASQNMSEITFESPSSLIFGNESSGLPSNFVEIGKPLIIKHSNEIDSLNLSIACSIALYEYTKKSFQ